MGSKRPVDKTEEATEKKANKKEEGKKPASAEASAGKSTYKKSKKKKLVTRGKVYIQATYNNTIVTVCDQSGNALAWSSAGHLGFKGAKKATPYAAGEIVRNVAEKIKDIGLRDVEVFVKGIGSGREAAVRAFNAQGFNIISIKDTTPLPHNGCRPKKPRRV